MAVRKKSPLKLKYTESHQCSVDLRLRILSRVPFFRCLPLDTLAQINPLFTERGFQKDAMICAAGDPAESLYVIADGRVRLLHHSLSGKEIVLDLLTAGEFFGSLSSLGDDVYPDSAQAQTPACILTIGKESFRKILDQQPPVALQVLEIMAARLRFANERVHQLSVLPVEARIANSLLHLCDKFGQKHALGRLIQIPLSRDDLAAMTGTTTETASRVMSQFQKAGMIESGREWVAVTSLSDLEAAAGREVT